MRYNYDVDKECFVRADGLGKKFYINITEAQRIATLHDLGNTVSEINNKIDFKSRKVSESTIKNFINNVNEGNIVITGDYPVPVSDFKEFTVDEKVLALEDRVKNIENILSELKPDCFVTAFAGETTDVGLKERFKTWLRQ